MEGFSPKLPLVRDKLEGLYLMNKTASESIKQDFKMLVLTNPGERIMLPEYGVGIKKLLFEQNTPTTLNQIRERIINQTQRYMNFIQLNNVDVSSDELNENIINVEIEYIIPAVSANLQQISISVSK